MREAPNRLLASQSRFFSSSQEVWLRFPKLTKYHAGLYNLIPFESNKPEYPQAEPLSELGQGKAGDSSENKEKANGSNDYETKKTENRGSLGVTAKSRVFNPYPNYSSAEYRAQWDGDFVPCSFGYTINGTPRDRPEIRVFDGIPEGMPNPVFGSHELLGFDEGVCFERYGRLGPYGYGYTQEDGGLGEAIFNSSTRENGVETAHGVGAFPLKKIDWRGVDWGSLQIECLRANQERFKKAPDTVDSLYPNPAKRNTTTAEEEKEDEEGKSPSMSETKKKHPRTAVLLRTWTGYTYNANDIANLRSLISELSILSGGEYTVHILLHVKDNTEPIWASPDVYQRILSSSGLPEEFWGLTELWNEALMQTLYSRVRDSDPELSRQTAGIPIHAVYRSSFMPVQWFAKRHPEYDYFWNWEMDVRYTGHLYHLLERLDRWTTSQPRKGLWERNSRFYIPAAHGSWELFSSTVSASSTYNNTILGPMDIPGVRRYPSDPPLEEHSNWGVDEPADLIALNPLFDPAGSPWILSNEVAGYPSSIPRRASIIATVRLSRRLIEAMHKENYEDGHMVCTEMFPPTVALHHGLKAVYAPHPVYMERRWPIGYLDQTFNSRDDISADGSHGLNIVSPNRAMAKGSGGVFGVKKEHNFRGTSWYYDARFGGEIYRRWIGSSLDEDGDRVRDVDDAMREKSGRMCLRGWLIHPVKRA
jgi:hypothetical protein